MSIPFIDLKAQYRALEKDIAAAIGGVIDHGQFIMGPEVAEMEQALAAYAGTAHCVAVASGTEALLISLMALGIGPGDEVIVPAFTFAATAEVVVLAGATPVLVDIELDSCNIDPSAIEPAVTERTRAIMPVSLYGQPADMSEISAIASRHGLAVVEDAAQSFGASYGNRRSCALSTIGCTSFFPSKPLACYGDGGALFTDDDDIAQASREIRATTIPASASAVGWIRSSARSCSPSSSASNGRSSAGSPSGPATTSCSTSGGFAGSFSRRTGRACSPNIRSWLSSGNAWPTRFLPPAFRRRFITRRRSAPSRLIATSPSSANCPARTSPRARCSACRIVEEVVRAVSAG